MTALNTLELYDGKKVDLLLKLTQSNCEKVPEWLINSKNVHRNQLQLEFLANAPCARRGASLYRIGDIIYQTIQYEQSADEEGFW